MLKQAARSAIKTFAKRAPWAVRGALLEGLCEQSWGTKKRLSQLAYNAHISAFLAEGEYGLIQSSPGDETLIRTYARTGTWAAATIAFFRKILGDGSGTYIDVGANIGLTTIPIAQNPGLRCIAFEPDPTNFGHLTENVRRNCRYNNVELVQMAVMDRSGTVSFGLDRSGNPGDHRVVTGSTARKTISVAATTLDDYCANARSPLAVKIDTQGAEPFVVRGGWKILTRASALVMEFEPNLMVQLGTSPDPIYALIREFSTAEFAPGEGIVEQTFHDTNQAISVLSRHFEEAKGRPGYWNIYLTR
jgi:FkbM family methyltransferase